MNKPIRRVAFVAMVMFALLLANVTYAVLFRQASLDANAQNRRTRDAEFAQDRPCGGASSGSSCCRGSRSCEAGREARTDRP